MSAYSLGSALTHSMTIYYTYKLLGPGHFDSTPHFVYSLLVFELFFSICYLLQYTVHMQFDSAVDQLAIFFLFINSSV